MPILLPGLKTARERAGLSQEQLAAKASLSTATVAKHEQGILGGISGETLDQLVAALGVDRAALFLPHNSELSEKEVTR